MLLRSGVDSLEDLDASALPLATACRNAVALLPAAVPLTARRPHSLPGEISPCSPRNGPQNFSADASAKDTAAICWRFRTQPNRLVCALAVARLPLPGSLPRQPCRTNAWTTPTTCSSLVPFLAKTSLLPNAALAAAAALRELLPGSPVEHLSAALRTTPIPARCGRGPQDPERTRGARLQTHPRRVRLPHRPSKKNLCGFTYVDSQKLMWIQNLCGST